MKILNTVKPSSISRNHKNAVCISSEVSLPRRRTAELSTAIGRPGDGATLGPIEVARSAAGRWPMTVLFLLSAWPSSFGRRGDLAIRVERIHRNSPSSVELSRNSIEEWQISLLSSRSGCLIIRKYSCWGIEHPVWSRTPLCPSCVLGTFVGGLSRISGFGIYSDEFLLRDVRICIAAHILNSANRRRHSGNRCRRAAV